MAKLHPTRSHRSLTPDYVTHFRCTGPDCPDNCCTGWRVTLDKKTFVAYRQVKQPGLAELLPAHIKRIRSNPTDASYASIQLDPGSGECPFMQDRLCAVQRDLGEDYLSNTCNDYPRHTRRFADQIEQSLTLSCPEAARLALLSPNAFDFVETTLTLREETISTTRPPKGLTLDQMNEARLFCMQVIRTEALELWQRLAVLGLFCEQLSAILAAPTDAKLRELISNFTEMIERGWVIEALGDMKPDHTTQAQIFAMLWQTKNTRTHSELQRKTMEQIAKGLGAVDESGIVGVDTLTDAYTVGVARLPDALRQAPHLLDHYLLNEMFRELFPFADSSPYQHYLRLVTRYGLVRLMLAALCNGAERLPTPDESINVVHIFCRRYQHDQHFASHVNTALKNSGWDKLEKVYRFLRA